MASQLTRCPERKSLRSDRPFPTAIDSGGHLKSYNEVFERLVTQHFMKQEKMSRPEAEKAATEHLKNVPAWRDL